MHEWKNERNQLQNEPSEKGLRSEKTLHLKLAWINILSKPCRKNFASICHTKQHLIYSLKILSLKTLSEQRMMGNFAFRVLL